jgi:HK97 family phage portal protein
MTGFEYKELQMKHLTSWGNSYSQIEYDARGQISELWPLLPQNMLSSKIQGKDRIYTYQEENGKIVNLSSQIIWHIKGLGNGLDGLSPLGLMRRVIGLGLSAEEFGKKFFDNDARPGIVLEHPASLSDKAYKNLKESWEEDHKGVSKSHRMRILEEGMKIHEVGIPPEDAQFLETRKFQKSEIASIFRVPPHMIADLDKASFSNIEHQGIEFVKYSILPWAKRYEESIYKFLYLPKDRANKYPEFLLAGLERGDIASRYTAYAQGKQNGWLSTNDIRKLENMDPVEHGDMYLVPLNMVPADQVGNRGVRGQVLGVREEIPGVLEEFEPAISRMRTEQIENRALRSVTARHRIAQSFERVILDVAERVMRREVNDVSKAVTKFMGKRDSAQFLIWLDEFYQEHADFMTRQFFPIFLSFAESIAAESMDEVAADADLKDRLERFVRSYSGSFAAQQTGISLFRMKKALQDALDSGVDPEEAMNAELDHWREARPGEIAMDQKTRAGSSVAKFVYSAVGILTLRWVTMGDTCPYCKALDGRVISIAKNFLSPGESFEPEGAEGPMTTTSDIGHPPLHGGCDCSIAAG